MGIRISSSTWNLVAGGLLLAVFATRGLPASAAFAPGDSIAGYVHTTGAGSRVDIRADGTHNGASWTVVFQRKLQTGDPSRDVQFVPGQSYAFQVATWDNSGGMSHDMSDAAIVYTMTIPANPGPLGFSGLPNVLTSLTGDYLPSEEIQIVASWNDATKNDQRKRWSFDGATWSLSSDNEDRVAFIWDLQGDEFASAGTCASMCHGLFMYTAPGTWVDTWHWKATRTNPAGYSDDKYWDDGMGGTASGRHSDPGLAPYIDNTLINPPVYQAEDDPGSNAAFLFEVILGMKEGVGYAGGPWNAGDVLPGYLHRRGSGSAVDVFSTSTYDVSVSEWSVTFRRKLDTGDAAGDITFAPGGSYDFQVATWNNDGGMNHDMSEASNVYTMTIPTSPGALVFSGTPALFSSLSGQLLASDEVEITVTWPDTSRDDLRAQWQFDGTNWAQTLDNEDRVTFLWDMQGDGFNSAGTCASMCHFPFMYTAPGTFVDTWHWKATRTGAIGFTDDKHWDDGAGGTVSGRLGDDGTSVYQANLNVGGVPSFMAAAGPGNSADYLFEHVPAAGWKRAVVPEPSQLVLQLAAIGCLGLLARRGRRLAR